LFKKDFTKQLRVLALILRCCRVLFLKQECCEAARVAYRSSNVNAPKAIRVTQSGRVTQMLASVSSHASLRSIDSSKELLPPISQSTNDQREKTQTALFACQDCQRLVNQVIPSIQLDSVLSRYNWWAVVLKDAKTSLIQVSENDLRTKDMTVKVNMTEEKPKLLQEQSQHNESPKDDNDQLQRRLQIDTE